MIDQSQRPFLSVVIPAYNEEQRLPDSLEKIAHFLRTQPYRSEIIVVENGSRDNTSGVVEDFQETQVADGDPFILRLLHSRQGKGIAVKTGMMAAQGAYCFMCDADLSMPIEEVAKFVPPQLPAGSYDIAIASREIPGAVRHGEPAHRHFMGRIFNFIVRAMAIPQIEDTQCGFKCFTASSVKTVFPRQRIEGWGFDIETLFIGLQHDLRIVEVPINWYYQANSRIHPVRDSINMFLELLKIRQNGRRGLYR